MTTRHDIYLDHKKRERRTRLGDVITFVAVITAAALLGILFVTLLDIMLAPLADASTGQVNITPEEGTAGNAGIIGPAIVIGLAVSFVKKVVDFPRYFDVGDVKGALWQVGAWIAGVAVAFLLQATDWAKDIQLAGVVLGDTNAATVVFFGAAIASAAGLVNDAFAAVDNTRSSAITAPVDANGNGN